MKRGGDSETYFVGEGFCFGGFSTACFLTEALTGALNFKGFFFSGEGLIFSFNFTRVDAIGSSLSSSSGTAVVPLSMWRNAAL